MAGKMFPGTTFVRRRSGSAGLSINKIIRGEERFEMGDEKPIKMLSHRFFEALVGAARLHSGQFRKGTTIPYIAHLLGVTSIALEFGASEDEAIAAVLHDVIEDIPPPLDATWARQWIAFNFGPEVLDIVEGCTDTDEQPKPAWIVRKIQYVEHIATASSSVVLVSASDKLHNARAILTDFRQMGDALWPRFNREAGKAGTIGYYRGLVAACQKTGHHPQLVRELDQTVSHIEESAKHRGVWPHTSTGT
jgi:GTP pyrophosphokinase